MKRQANTTPSLQFLGAAGGVTGSKYLLTFGKEQILIDCGLFQGMKEMRLRNWSTPPIDVQQLRAVALTHAHIDHSGYLPRLAARGFKGPVYATPATCDLLRMLLPDAAYLQEEEARYANKRGYSKHHPALPLYTVTDAERALRLLVPMRFTEEVELINDVALRFLRVGHILGAAAVRITFRDGNQNKSLLDSGDLGRYGRPILKDPDPVKKADWLLLESTYGDRHHPENPEEELAKVINEVANESGFLLVPAFAVGRTQELIYEIRQLEDAGKIPALPVHVDSPMAASATEVYCKYIEEHDLDIKRLKDEELCSIRTRYLTFHRTSDDSKAINALRGPRIIVSASGMASGGRILHHLRLRLPDPKTTILFVGFQAEGTRGRALQEGKKEIKMFGELIPVRAKIKTIDGFSAHADQGEILRWLSNFEKAPQRTYIVHGEPNASSVLAETIRQSLKWNVDIPKYGEKIWLSRDDGARL